VKQKMQKEKKNLTNKIAAKEKKEKSYLLILYFLKKELLK
jgi:hypothetical protein